MIQIVRTFSIIAVRLRLASSTTRPSASDQGEFRTVELAMLEQSCHQSLASRAICRAHKVEVYAS